MLPTAANKMPSVLSAFRFYSFRPTHGSAKPERVVFRASTEVYIQSRQPCSPVSSIMAGCRRPLLATTSLLPRSSAPPR